MDRLERCRRALRALAADLSRAQDDERHRIARGLHDDVGQLLVAARMRLHRLARQQEPAQREPVAEVGRLLDSAIAATRELTFELMAPPAIDLDIDAALATLADGLTEMHGVPCTFTTDPAPKPLSTATARALFRVVRELLANVAKHAEATSAAVAVAAAGGRLQVEVCDDGVGFPTPSDVPPEQSGAGLLIVAERLAEVGGEIDISSAAGRGSRVAVSVPLHVDLREGGAA